MLPAPDRRLFVACAALTILGAAPALAEDAAAGLDLPPFGYGTACHSGVYPHLAALSDSYSEAGIGAVVPWAGRLWYVSYVAHKAGSGVGLYEIDVSAGKGDESDLPRSGPQRASHKLDSSPFPAPLGIRRRPESIVGTHANRMIHRETNQLIIGPYLIDSKGNVRVFRALADERLTGTMRHLTDPAHKVYFQAMEGNFYEADLRTLTATKLYNLTETLGIGARTHFKGAYTAQGRVVVANNSYFEEDQRDGQGRGRLAEWDGREWTILERTAFCDVTTAAGIMPVDDDQSTLWANGWDRRSVVLKVLHEGQWHTYRLPKGSQSYDQAWCTEWPRIRSFAPGQMLLDMHGLYYKMSPEFRPGSTGGLAPYVSHLKMTPDFCTCEHAAGKESPLLVFAGNENSSMGHRLRTGGQPQSNLWFGTLEQVGEWGSPAGWGGPWLGDPVQADLPSDPFLIRGFSNRTLHLSLGGPAPGPAGPNRTTSRFDIVQLPEALAGLAWVTVDRGPMEKPGASYSFEVDRDVVVYLAVHDRGSPTLPEGWQKTGMTIEWQHGGPYTDTVYRKAFPKGKVEIPPHDGHNELKHYGVPHMAFVAPAAKEGDAVRITGLPKDLGAATSRPKAPPATAGGRVVFTLEVDKIGTGFWSKYRQIEVPAGGYAWLVLPRDLDACWMRITPDRDTVATAQFHFGPKLAGNPEGFSPIVLTPGGVKQPESAGPFPEPGKPAPLVAGALLPFANRLWFVSHVEPGDGKAPQPGALYEIDKDMKFVRREESVPGVFANRKMVGRLLSIGPHLISEDGEVRTLGGLEGRHLAASIRFPGSDEKMYLLTTAGQMLACDLKTLAVAPGPDAAKELGLAGEGLVFKAGHTAGKTVVLAAVGAGAKPGVLAEWDGAAWRVIDRADYAEVSNLGAMSEQVVAVGWDRASTILMLGTPGAWKKHRLPKAAEDYPPQPASLSPRIREVVTERMLFDAGGLWYEVSGLPYVWSVKPISTHGRHVPDYCSWRGLLVLAGARADAQSGPNYVRGEDGAGLWFGTVDDLWRFGKPRGVGGPWRDAPVRAGEPSDPYLMANFDRKTIELTHDSKEPVRFALEVDFTVQRSAWRPLETITVQPGEKAVYPFPAGYSAHWVRVKADRDCRATAWFVYE